MALQLLIFADGLSDSAKKLLHLYDIVLGFERDIVLLIY